MKVLFLHQNQPDYLAESLFHGLRTVLGSDCIDAPRYDSLYAPLTDSLKSKMRGHGFTLYGLLEDIPKLSDQRFFWRKDLAHYDLIVIGNIWEQWQQVWNLAPHIAPEKMVVLDGYDSPSFFPYTLSGLKNQPWSYFAPVSRFKYFKRELIGEGHSYGVSNRLPRILRKWIPLPKNARPIAFSIPEQKIKRVVPASKTKDFPIHIVDQEVAEQLPHAFFSATGSDKLFFTDEADYIDDLTKSRFGITTKRAGWDCLRHYELAANGCVLCFRDLDKKPATCAPYGLDESNCIIYRDSKELKDRIASMTDEEYSALQEQTYKWIDSNTTANRARQFLDDCLNHIPVNEP